MRMIAFLIVAAMGLTGSVEPVSSEEWTETQEVMVPACEMWVNSFCLPMEFVTWTRKTLSRADDIVSDGRSANREEAIRSMVLSWIWDNEKSLKKGDRKALKTACFYFLLFAKHKIVPPLALRQRFGIDEAIKLARQLVDMTKLAEADKRGGSER